MTILANFLVLRPKRFWILDCHDMLIYVSTFTKTLLPGLRIGYMVATGKHYRRIVEQQRLLNDLHSSTVSQAIVSEVLALGHDRRHLNRLSTNNLQSRNVMLQALGQHFPAEVSWTILQGGLFLWTHLPTDISIEAIRRAALSQNVLVADGAAFFPRQQGYPAMRLNFSHASAEIELGISILGRSLKQALTKSTIIPLEAVS